MLPHGKLNREGPLTGEDLGITHRTKINHDQHPLRIYRQLQAYLRCVQEDPEGGVGSFKIRLAAPEDF